MTTDAKLLAMAEDALTLLEGWIRRYCKPSFLSEHLEDLAKKRAILDAAKSSPRYVQGEGWRKLPETEATPNAIYLGRAQREASSVHSFLAMYKGEFYEYRVTVPAFDITKFISNSLPKEGP